MGFVCGAEDEQWLNPVRQDHQTELLFILCEAQDGAWHWTQSRQATRGLHTYPFLSVCVFVLVSAMLDPQDTHPPISQNSTEDVMLREQWNPATNALACEISEGMWGTAMWSDNVLLKIPKHSLEASCLAGRGSADYVRKSLSAVCSHHPVETTEGPISIVGLTSVLTCAHSGVRFSTPLCGWHINPKEIIDSRIICKPVSWTLFWFYFAFVYLLNEVSVAWLWTNKAAEHFVWHQWNVECQLATVLRGKENVPGSFDISLESLFRLGHP